MLNDRPTVAFRPHPGAGRVAGMTTVMPGQEEIARIPMASHPRPPARFEAEPLPIDAVLPQLASTLRRGRTRVLVAPPGAGKTTRVPLALLDSPGRTGGTLILLEPRRLAARAAADRMAATLGEAVGETVGLRVRLGSKRRPAHPHRGRDRGRVRPHDPRRSGARGRRRGAVRRVPRALARCRPRPRASRSTRSRAARGPAPSGDVGDARRRAGRARCSAARRSIESQGRGLPGRDALSRPRPAPAHRGARSRRRARARCAPNPARSWCSCRARARSAASRRCWRAHRRPASRHRAALRRAGPGRAGPRRRAGRAGPPQGRARDLDRRDLADHRGRAGGDRFGPRARAGLRARHRADAAGDGARLARRRRPAPRPRRPHGARRLLSPVGGGRDRRAASPSRAPEILVRRPRPARCSTAPPGASPIRRRSPSSTRRPRRRSAEARALLRRLGALDADGRITDHGRAHARAAAAAAPRPHGGRRPRRRARPARPPSSRPCSSSAGSAATPSTSASGSSASAATARRARRGHAPAGARLGRGAPGGGAARCGDAADRPRGRCCSRSPIRTGSPGRAAGRANSSWRTAAARELEAHDPLARAPFLAVAEIAGAAGAARILAAAPIDLDEIEQVAGARIVSRGGGRLRPAARALRARARTPPRRASMLDGAPLPVAGRREAARPWRAGIAALGLDALPWTRALSQWRDRVAFLRRAEGDDWPDVSDAALAAGRRGWLAPHLLGKAEPGGDRPRRSSRGALEALLPWELRRRLDAEAPTHVDVPTGSRIADRLRGRGRARSWRCACRSCSASTHIRPSPAGAFRSSSICCRRRIARSRSPATCRGSGAAPGRRCVPRCAGAIRGIPGRTIPLAAPPTRRAKPRGG